MKRDSRVSRPELREAQRERERGGKHFRNSPSEASAGANLRKMKEPSLKTRLGCALSITRTLRLPSETDNCAPCCLPSLFPSNDHPGDHKGFHPLLADGLSSHVLPEQSTFGIAHTRTRAPRRSPSLLPGRVSGSGWASCYVRRRARARLLAHSH